MVSISNSIMLISNQICELSASMILLYGELVYERIANNWHWHNYSDVSEHRKCINLHLWFAHDVAAYKQIWLITSYAKVLYRVKCTQDPQTFGDLLSTSSNYRSDYLGPWSIAGMHQRSKTSHASINRWRGHATVAAGQHGHGNFFLKKTFKKSPIPFLFLTSSSFLSLNK